MTGKSSKGAERGSVGGDEIREVLATQSRQGLVGSKESLDLIPVGHRQEVISVIDSRLSLTFPEVIPKLLLLRILSFCVSALPLRSRGKTQGAQRMRGCWVRILLCSYCFGTWVQCLNSLNCRLFYRIL